MRRRAALYALAALLALATGAQAAPLFRRAPAASDAGEIGITRRQPLVLDRDALAALRNAQQDARLDGLPLGPTRDVTLDLERVAPLAAARVIEVTAAGVRAVAPSDTVFFVGRTADDPRSRVLVVAGRERVRGFVVTGDAAYLFGPDLAGTYRSYDLRDLHPELHPPRASFCDTDLHAALVNATARPRALGLPPAVKAAPAGALPLRLDLAIETDTELRNKFGSAQETADYVAALLAAANAIYERDLAVRLQATYVRIWSTTDPWTSSATDGQLNELRAYWTNPANDMLQTAGPRALVHFLSGKPVTGGIAYIAAVCSNTYGFGVSQVDGDFDLAFPSQIWDVVVFTHELGHGVGSDHTHCYDPPLDRCFNEEPGCYDGEVVSSRGTIMSYCHLLGGLDVIDLEFPPPVQVAVRGVVELAPCLEADGPVLCGDGALDPDEQCDDGNLASGDGCSAICRFEACGNGFRDVGEDCDDGNVAGGDGCSATCAVEACGNDVVDVGEGCDDGNVEPGDGCTATCAVERCPVLVSHQANWVSGRVLVRRPARGAARLTVKARFAVPSTATIDTGATGIELVLEDESRAAVLDAALPGGPPWTVHGARATYKDGGGTVAGIRRATIRTRPDGPVTDVKVAVAGVGGPYPETLTAMPRRLTVLLGDVAAVATGACGERTFGQASCRSTARGAKLVCQ